jgi:hypothetical protein
MAIVSTDSGYMESGDEFLSAERECDMDIKRLADVRGVENRHPG